MARARRAVAPVPAFRERFQEVRNRLPGGTSELLRGIREEALARFDSLGLPSPRAEEWKYAPLASRVNRPMRIAEALPLGLEPLSRWFAGGPAARRLIFVNGHFLAGPSHVGGLPEGIRIHTLSYMAEHHPRELARALADLDEDRSFTRLNTALFENGAWIEVADGVRMEVPLQLLFVHAGGEAAAMTHPRIILRLGEGAGLHLLETHAGTGKGSIFVNLVRQVALAAGAELRHERLETGIEEASLLSRTVIRMEAGSRLEQTVASLGAGFLRNETEVSLEGSGAEALLSGLYMPRRREHVDTLVRVHHRAPSCHSDQFYKGVVDEEAQAAFAGKIIVHRGAQKTNAYQANRNLLLSDRAEVDSKPELEIYADDVKCSHGATCGDLEEDALFYLRSRGIAEGVARSLLIFAFANEVTERIRDERLRKAAHAAMRERVPGGDNLEAGETLP